MFFRSIEPLEARIAPAAVATYHFKDRDGDDVAITVSTPTGTSAALKTALTAATTFGLGDNGLQLQRLNLVPTIFEDASVKIIASRNPIAGGDGFVAVGAIIAEARELRNVFVDGDLGRITAGDGAGSIAVKNLTVRSLGLYGLETQGNVNPDLFSYLDGSVGTVIVKEDITGARFETAHGNVGSIFIGGSLLGTGEDDSDAVVIDANVGTVAIGGSLVSGLGNRSATLRISGGASFINIRGSLFGAEDATADGAGQLNVDGSVGVLSIRGDIVSGDGDYAGPITQVTIQGGLGTLNLRGSLLGTSALGDTGLNAGSLTVFTALGTAKISGSLVGGLSARSGSLFLDTVGTVFIGGDILGGGTNSGVFKLGESAGRVTVLGDLIGGVSAVSGGISGFSAKIGTLTIGGNVESRGQFIEQGFVQLSYVGKLLVKGDVIASSTPNSLNEPIDLGAFGQATILGSLRGNTTNGLEWTTGAFSSLRIGGNVEYAEIAATGKNLEIQSLDVGGAWRQSRFVAGSSDDGADNIFGTADDPAFAADATTSVARIIIAGQVAGTLPLGDAFFISAPQIVFARIAGATLPLAAGPQFFELGIAGDTIVRDKL